jgi:hypothetical protein
MAGFHRTGRRRTRRAALGVLGAALLIAVVVGGILSAQGGRAAGQGGRAAGQGAAGQGGQAGGPAAAGTGTTTAQAADTAATVTGFWSGTDSTFMAVPGPAPFREPAIGGSYGGYIGMAGNWSAWQHCGTKVVWSATDSADARTNLVTYHKGIGVGDYWFMAGPGVDPHYNGTVKEATTWGAAQAARTLSDLSKQSPAVTYPVVFMDVELPGNAPSFTPASDNGWNNVYTSACSGRIKSAGVSANLDRADFNGFASYLTSHSAYKAGVYSAPAVWRSIFGTGADSAIPNTYEWTYIGDTSSLAHHPSGWCLSGTKTCAQFFGGVARTSKYALMWQWSGGGGTFNGFGDFDQIDASRTP